MTGLVIAVVMAAASVHDNAIGIALPDKVTIDNPAVTKALGDAGFKNAITQHVAALGIKTKTVRRDPQSRGSAPSPKRWVVEQVYGALMLHRRLVHDHERLTTTAESMIYRPMADTMTRRPTGTTTTTWRSRSMPDLAA